MTQIETNEINNNFDETELLYLKNTYLHEGINISQILKFDKDAKGAFAILDKTLFYPQGGGQPSDMGQIEIIDSDVILNINFVSIVNGKVQHYYKEELDEKVVNDLIGKRVSLKIDSARRLNNAKSHTSGHLLASVVEKLAPELKGTKGYHFPEGPYIEFIGKLTSMSSEDLITKAHELLKESINNSTKLHVIDDGHIEELQAASGNQKKNRLVQIDGFESVPCGGTHLSNLSELKEVTIRKIQFPKGNTKIAYSFA